MRMGLYVKYQYYAHRTIPGLLVQEIKVVNPSDSNMNLDVLHSSPPNSWLASSSTIRYVFVNMIGFIDFYQCLARPEIKMFSDIY